jgi:hypothetical protein
MKVDNRGSVVYHNPIIGYVSPRVKGTQAFFRCNKCGKIKERIYTGHLTVKQLNGK